MQTIYVKVTHHDMRPELAVSIYTHMLTGKHISHPEKAIRLMNLRAQHQWINATYEMVDKAARDAHYAAMREAIANA